MRTKLIWAVGFPTCVAALIAQLALPVPAHAALTRCRLCLRFDGLDVCPVVQGESTGPAGLEPGDDA